jgi:hypothetical protein
MLDAIDAAVDVGIDRDGLLTLAKRNQKKERSLLRAFLLLPSASQMVAI